MLLKFTLGGLTYFLYLLFFLVFISSLLSLLSITNSFVNYNNVSPIWSLDIEKNIFVSVPDAFFSTKFTFSSNRTSEFESVPNVVIGSSTKPSTPVGDITTGKESRVNGKSVSNDVVVVKSEADEVNKIQCTDVVDDDCVRSDRGDGSREDLEKRQNGTQQIVTTVQVGQANEPDSTDSRLSQDSQKNEGKYMLLFSTPTRHRYFCS